MKKKTQTKILSGPGIEATIKEIKKIDKTITAVQVAGVKYTTIANSSQVNEEQKQACLDLVDQLARLAVCYDKCREEYQENGKSEDFMCLFKQAETQHSEVVDAQLDLLNAVTTDTDTTTE